MIEKIIGATIVPSIQALTWADQIGYLVKPWTKRVQTAEGQFTDVIYPVAEFVTNGDCQVQDYGLHVLTTDKGYTSLILISAEGDMNSEIAEDIPQRRAVNIEQDIKVTVWLNNHQGTTHIAKAELMKTLYRAVYNQVTIQWPYVDTADTDYDIFINKLKCTFLREVQAAPFSEYTFSKDQAQFANTYSAFAFVFKLTGLVFPNCMPDYPVLDADACENPTQSEMITTSGTYTPTVAALFNVDTIEAAQAQYMRVGNTVTVSGTFSLILTDESTPGTFTLTIPVASDFGNEEDLAGTAICVTSQMFGGMVDAYTSTDKARIKATGADSIALTYSYTFTYQII